MTYRSGAFAVAGEECPMGNKDPEKEDEEDVAHQFVDGDSPEKSETDH